MPCIMYERAGVIWKAADDDWVGICREPELVLLQFVSQLMHACCASSTNSEEPEIDRWTEQIVQEMVGACALRRGLRMTASEEWEKPGD